MQNPSHCAALNPVVDFRTRLVGGNGEGQFSQSCDGNIPDPRTARNPECQRARRDAPARIPRAPRSGADRSAGCRAGKRGFHSQVYGANFIPGSTVNWNRQPRATTYISGHELQATILAPDIAANTAGMITVSTTSPNGPTTSSTYFQVEVHDARPTMGSMTGVTYKNIDAFYNLTADFTNNNSVDPVGIIGGAHSSNIMGTLINNGKGVFRLGSPITTNEYPYAAVYSTAVGDFNGDGNVDFLYLIGGNSQSTPTQLAISFGNGNGTFTPRPVFGSFGPRGPGIPDVVVGDFNQDGVLDVAALDGGNRSTEMFLGNGDGTFTQGKPFYSGRCGNFIVGDFNGDGKLDLLCTADEQGGKYFNFQIIFGNGDGPFQPPRSIAISPYQPLFSTTFFVNDFNNDGNLDIAFSAPNGQVGILLNNGDGSFQSPVYYTVGDQYPFTFALGDFNNDGKTDIIAIEDVPLTFKLLLGNGDGTFQGPQVLSTPAFTGLAFTVADFNNDGLLDFAFPAHDYYLYFQQ
jgi:hypothetical protein